MKLQSAVIPLLDLDLSYTGSIDALGISTGVVTLGDGFHANGSVAVNNSRVGDFYAANGHFKCLLNPGDFHPAKKLALNLINMQTKGGVYLIGGFEANGQVWLDSAKIGGDLAFRAGHFLNPGSVAIGATAVDVLGRMRLAGSLLAAWLTADRAVRG